MSYFISGIELVFSEAVSFLTEPVVMAVIAVVSSIMLIICTVLARDMRRDIDRLTNEVSDEKDVVKYLQAKVDDFETPTLYNEYPGFENGVPLGLLPGIVLRGYKEPSFANLLKFATAVTEDPEAVNELTAVLETDRGAFVRTLEVDASRHIHVDEDGMGMGVTAHWLPITCGQACKANLYIVFRDLILRHVHHSIDMRAGDKLNVHYTLNPDDLG